MKESAVRGGVQCGNFVDKEGSSDADVRTFWWFAKLMLCPWASAAGGRGAVSPLGFHTDVFYGQPLTKFFFVLLWRQVRI